MKMDKDGISGSLRMIISKNTCSIPPRCLALVSAFHSAVCYISFIYHLWFASRSLSAWIPGTQIYVFGFLPPGEEPVSAGYSIDGGSPQVKSLESSPYVDVLYGNTTLFMSPPLKFGDHNISIVVNETGQNGRNFTLDYFQVIQPEGDFSNQTAGAGQELATTNSKNDIAAIVGGVVGASISLIIVLLLILWMRRRKVLFYERRRLPGIPCFRRTKSSDDECTSLSSGTVRPEAEISTVSPLDPEPFPFSSRHSSSLYSISSHATLVNVNSPNSLFKAQARH